MDLLDTYCLPSIKAQTCQDFKWLLYCDEETDPDVLAELRNRSREVPQLEVLVTTAHQGFREVTSKLIDPAAEILITTRLDSDDALHMSYVEAIQARLLDFKTMGTPKWLVNFPRGYQLDRARERLLLDWEPRSPFHSFFEWNPVQAMTVLLGNHSVLHLQHPTAQDDSLAAWLMVIHGGNAENQLKEHYTGEASVSKLAEFGIQSSSVSSRPSMPATRQDEPIALRTVGEFSARQASIFEDPADEKSSHSSQRVESLATYYGDREPSWYSSAIRPLEGAARVLDLGCGPGLALRALVDQGVTEVMGIDRWPAFASNPDTDLLVVEHDLTLPMPFIPSGSVDGVFSHYALDYLSPIGMRQTLREAHRILAPDGRLLLYLAAVGLGAADDTRTIPYSPPVLERLLEEAGFSEISVEASANGRNSIVRARRPGEPVATYPPVPGAVSGAVGRETQLSAAFERVNADKLEVEVKGGDRTAVLRIALPAQEGDTGSRIAVCARVVPLPSHGFELQVWTWLDTSPVATESVRVEFWPTELRLHCDGEVEHLDIWTPRPVASDTPGSAYSPATDFDPDEQSSEAERGAEGRRLVVQAPSQQWSEVVNLRGKGRNRLLIRRSELGLGFGELDRDWLAGRLHGIVVTADDLAEPSQAILLWPGQRQALLLIEGANWDVLLTALANRIDDLLGPVVVVDPALTGAGNLAPPQFALGSFVERNPQTYVALSTHSREQLGIDALQQLRPALLHGGAPDAASVEGSNEALRYLAERTMLMQLRKRYGRSPSDVGRRPALD